MVIASVTIVNAQAQAVHKNGARVSCSDGQAAGFSCENVDLLSVLTPVELGATQTCGNGDKHQCALNDMWGWTDPLSGKEYALVGRYDGTSFVDVSNPLSPQYLGNLPSHGGTNVWRDIKVYANHAYIVADNVPGHGMQIFDLTQLRGEFSEPVEFSEFSHYPSPGFGETHNIVINEDSGFAYLVGGAFSCGRGMHILDLANPLTPVFAGCFSYPATGRRSDGYVHDAQCVIYEGPDDSYEGQEICFGSNETHITVADMTDKGNPVMIAKADYPNVGYVHQNWLSEDQKYLFQNDELDERDQPAITRTRTLVWDVQDLDDPVLVTEYIGGGTSIDHNIYVKGDYVYQSNYVDGLRILDISDPVNPVEAGHFDTHNAFSDIWGGSWSNYPFFESGTIAVTDDTGGLFLVAPTMSSEPVANEAEDVPVSLVVSSAYPNPFTSSFTIAVEMPEAQHVEVDVYDVLGRQLKAIHSGMITAASSARFEVDLSEYPAGTYYYRLTGETFSVTKPILLSK
jgi:choice-of-anchor B domain-containing protein